jgi:DMSO/TMAO reductase YedYZ molybdopterin-dependent catalytic subunit
MTTVHRTGRARARRLGVVLAAVTLVLTGACGSAGSAAPEPAPSPAPSVIRQPDLAPGTVPAAPSGRPMLTVTGRIAATNAAGTLRLDQATVDRLGELEMSVNDPWARKRVVLRGVWLRDLVALARPDASATSLHLHALDDYQVDLALADVRADPILLATRDGRGAALPVEEGGPSRVVFADDLAHRFSPDLWIWNIDTVEVR